MIDYLCKKGIQIDVVLKQKLTQEVPAQFDLQTKTKTTLGIIRSILSEKYRSCWGRRPWSTFKNTPPNKPIASNCQASFTYRPISQNSKSQTNSQEVNQTRINLPVTSTHQIKGIDTKFSKYPETEKTLQIFMDFSL